MKLVGRCYCGSLRYNVNAEPVFQGLCHCRECRYISGGGVNAFVAIPTAVFEYSQGTPATSRDPI